MLFVVDNCFLTRLFFVKVPLVPPGLSHKVAINAENRNKEVEEEKNVIKVFVVRKGQTRPLVAANIAMPSVDVF